MKKLFAYLSYLNAALFFLTYILIEFVPDALMTVGVRLFLLCGSCIFLYVGGYLLADILNDNKPMKINLWIFFALYLLLLITLTFFDPMWGRVTIGNWQIDGLKKHLESGVNLIPFATIYEYLNALFSSRMQTSIIFLNLIGNFVCLMPFAVFIPLLFDKTKNFKKFLITTFSITLGIEILQLLTLSGRFDIDDIILNFGGAIVLYRVVKDSDIYNFLQYFFLKIENKINYRVVLKKITIMSIIIIFIIGGFIIRHHYYLKP